MKQEFKTDPLKYIEFSLSEAFKDLFAEMMQNREDIKKFKSRNS